MFFVFYGFLIISAPRILALWAGLSLERGESGGTHPHVLLAQALELPRSEGTLDVLLGVRGSAPAPLAEFATRLFAPGNFLALLLFLLSDSGHGEARGRNADAPSGLYGARLLEFTLRGVRLLGQVVRALLREPGRPQGSGRVLHRVEAWARGSDDNRR